jgi:hypothetical protein
LSSGKHILALAFAGAALAACVTPSPDARVIVTPPDRATFPAVADLLEHRCGSLDCHGTAARNLRLYGSEGLRLTATDRPTSVAGKTTTAEYDEDFLSVVALEPEILSQVVEEGGAQPERLTLVRKARGTEHHKGLAPFAIGDAGDVCLTSWLAGKTNTASCTQAAGQF